MPPDFHVFSEGFFIYGCYFIILEIRGLRRTDGFLLEMIVTVYVIQYTDGGRNGTSLI